MQRWDGQQVGEWIWRGVWKVSDTAYDAGTLFHLFYFKTPLLNGQNETYLLGWLEGIIWNHVYEALSTVPGTKCHL